MARGRGNGKRGGRGGGQGDGRGRGRGSRGRGRGMRGSYLLDESFDFNIQMYADANLEMIPYGNGRLGNGREPNSETSTPNRGRGRGFRGRGRGHPEMYSRNRHSDYGIGASPKDRGRGRGAQKLRADAPLTRLLYQERPLLRPITFVPSVHNPILFDQDEALLKPGVEEVGNTEQSHVPTAARVSRVFSGSNIHPMESSSEAENDDDANDEDEDEDELKVVDFNDVAKLFEPTKKSKKISSTKTSGDNNNSTSSHHHQPQHDLTDIDALTKMVNENLSATESYNIAPQNGPVEPSLFYTDTQPTPIPTGIAPLSSLSPSDEYDDDIIVYVAPHPRKGVQTSPEKEPLTNLNGILDTSQFIPYIRDASLSTALASSSSTATTVQQQPQTQIPSSFSFSFATPEGKQRGRLRVPAVTTPRLAKSWKRKRGVLTKKGGKHKSLFRTFGAMREEAQLHDPKQKHRRRGDSDLDWGDTDDDDVVLESRSRVHGNGRVNKGKGKAINVEDGHGMGVDSDVDLNAMQHFVGGLLSGDAGRHVTMDDLMDEERIRMENEQGIGEDGTSVDESGSEGSNDDDDEEVERVLADEEAMLISEALGFKEEDEEEDGSDDEDAEGALGDEEAMLISEALEYKDEEEDGSDEDEDQTPRTSFQKRLERLRNQASSSKHDDEYDFSDDYDDMMERNMIFADCHFGYSKARPFFELDEELEDFNGTKSKKNRQAGLPEHFQIQWEKDRLKKAAYKKARALARLEEAADPLSYKKGGKKGRKAMLAAARLDPTITVIPNRIIDMVTLVQQIKRFINDSDGPLTMSLPPTNKATRKNIHEIAIAFNLKSVSKGKGDARYTTLTKTLKSGLYVDEVKVAKIVRKSGARGDSFVQDRKGKTGRGLVPRHREGDEVGKAAPKLSSSNVGFRMLAMMGWSEGERIGATGGLQDPLTAIIKNTKLGLGAAK